MDDFSKVDNMQMDDLVRWIICKWMTYQGGENAGLHFAVEDSVVILADGLHIEYIFAFYMH